MIADTIVRNKYKLIAAIIILLIVVDGLMHKGLVRVVLPKKYPHHPEDIIKPLSKNRLINTNKNWVKAVNSIERMDGLDKQTSGIEFDIYFDTTKKFFDVHHDIDNSIGLDWQVLLKEYKKLGLQASLWVDFKNLDTSTAAASLQALISISNEYQLQNKILVESPRADLLNAFSDSGFYTAYYTPSFNPYLVSDDSLMHAADSIATVLGHSKVDALTGYYFQYSFLHNYFPAYPVLIWAPNDKYSLVNWLFKQKMKAEKNIFIALYP